MKIPYNDWKRYVERLGKINKTAAVTMQYWMEKNPNADAEQLVEIAHAVAEKYGEAAASLACEMYDAIAAAQKANVKPAEPAEPASYGETAKAVYGTLKNKQNTVPATVGRLVKQTGADTMLQNAARDRAQFAWVPMGDTCAFCMMLASRGWQYQSKKAMKNGHAEHIHANCDCEYCIRFDGKSTVEGYDPDKYLEMYENAEGDTWQEKVNSMRREMAAEKRETAKEQPQKKTFQFVPAKTIAEAEEYAKQFVDESRFGAVGVSYKGVSVDVANEVNRTVGQFFHAFDVEKFGGIAAPAGNTKLGKMMSNATAGYVDVRRSLLLNRTSLKTMESATEAFAAEKRALQNILEHPEMYDMSKASSVLRRVIENSTESGRGTIPETIEEAINHELGHSLERAVKRSDAWEQILENMGEYNHGLSGYACEDKSEYIAESFCSYMKGEDKCDPVLAGVFDSFRRK